MPTVVVNKFVCLQLFRTRRKIRHMERTFCVCGLHSVALMCVFILAQPYLPTAMKDCFGYRGMF